jgi:orotate phosphoribosyltransferase-like protein
MHNLHIREALKSKGIFGYQIAAEMGISETSFSRLLARDELTDEKKKEVFVAIKRIEMKRGERD